MSAAEVGVAPIQEAQTAQEQADLEEEALVTPVEGVDRLATGCKTLAAAEVEEEQILVQTNTEVLEALVLF